MIAYVKGTIIDITEENVIVDVNDIGYNIKISSDTANRLPGVGQQVQLHTYTCVREDAFLLYGFLTRNDLDIFRKCITVNGIGPKGALAILSVMDADSLRFAIMSGDEKAIARAPGIGARTAQRLILDLKDKVSIEETAFGAGVVQGDSAPPADTAQKKEALEALVSLGYGQTEALKAINTIEGIEDMDSSAVLKAALKRML